MNEYVSINVAYFSLFQIEDEMLQCIVCEDWYHSRVRQSLSL